MLQVLSDYGWENQKALLLASLGLGGFDHHIEAAYQAWRAKERLCGISFALLIYVGIGFFIDCGNVTGGRPPTEQVSHR